MARLSCCIFGNAGVYATVTYVQRGYCQKAGRCAKSCNLDAHLFVKKVQTPEFPFECAEWEVTMCNQTGHLSHFPGFLRIPESKVRHTWRHYWVIFNEGVTARNVKTTQIGIVIRDNLLNRTAQAEMKLD